MLSRERICSNRLACVLTCFPAKASSSATRPFGVIVGGCSLVVKEHSTGSGLPPLTCEVLCRLLTPLHSTAQLPALPLTVSDTHDIEVSPDKNANSNCTIPAFTSSSKLRASVCCATLPKDSALYAISVRGLTVLMLDFLSAFVYTQRSCLHLVF